MSVDVFGKEQGDTNLEVEEKIAEFERQLGLAKTFEIVANQLVELTSTGSATGASPVTASFAHGLKYAPNIVASIEKDGIRFPLPWMLYNITTGAIRARIYAQIDDTNVTFIYQDWVGEGVYTYPIRCYVLREPAQ